MNCCCTFQQSDVYTDKLTAFTKHTHFMNSSTSIFNTGLKTKCVIVTRKGHLQNDFDFTLYEFLAHYLVDPKATRRPERKFVTYVFPPPNLRPFWHANRFFFLTDYVRYINTDWALYDLVVFCFHLSILELRQKRTQLSQLINLS